MSGRHDDYTPKPTLEPSSNQEVSPPVNTPDVFIYNPDSGKYQEPTDLELKLKSPFSLSVSNLTQNHRGFTQYAKDGGEKVSLNVIESLDDFNTIKGFDSTGANLRYGNRNIHNFITSDVIVIDIDNDDGDTKYQHFWNDPNDWWCIDKFTLEFKDYEFVIKTSRNHDIAKKNRAARPKFHVFIPLGQTTEDFANHQLLLDRLKWFTRRDEDIYRLDKVVGPTHQFFGHHKAAVYYNPGTGLSITDFLNSEAFNDFNTDKALGATNNGVIGHTPSRNVSRTTRWENEHIVSTFDIYHFYPRISHKSDNGGYFVAHCDLGHADLNASMQVFPDLGFNCLACGKKGNALSYVLESRKNRLLATNPDIVPEIKKRDIVLEYCDKLSLDANEWFMLIPEEDDEEDDSVFSKELKDHYSVSDLGTQFVSRRDYTKLQELNEKYAVSIQGGKTVIVSNSDIPGKTWGELRPMSFEDFKKQFSNKPVKVKQIKITDGERKITNAVKTVADLWIGWQFRRQYDQMAFNPTQTRPEYRMRTWDGFDCWDSATPHNKWEGDPRLRGIVQFFDHGILQNIQTSANPIQTAKDGCKLYLQHIREIICGKYPNKENDPNSLINYVLLWMHKALFYHVGGQKLDVSLSLQSGQGVGKGTFATLFGELFGKWFCHIKDPERVTERFNYYLADKLLCFVDEAIFAGDPKQKSKQKTMISEEYFRVEKKFMDSYETPNFLKYIYASNDPHIVNLEEDDRRHCVIDLPTLAEINWRKYNPGGKKGYFDDLYSEWANHHGKEHFYFYLKNQPWLAQNATSFDFDTARIKTQGFVNQIVLSNPIAGFLNQIREIGGHYVQINGRMTVQEWWEDKPNIFTDASGSNYRGSKRQLYDSYTLYCDDINVKYKNNLEWFAKNCNRFCKQFNISLLIGKKERDSVSGKYKTAWVFPSLREFNSQWLEGVCSGIEPTSGDDLSEFDLDQSSKGDPMEFETHLARIQKDLDTKIESEKQGLVNKETE